MTTDKETHVDSNDDPGIDVYYEKGQQYINIHCDGSIVTPSGESQIVISIYNERFTIPRHVRMGPSDSSRREISEKVIDGKSGIFRQVECSIFLSPSTAKDLVAGIQEVQKFLEDQVNEKEAGSE